MAAEPSTTPTSLRARLTAARDRAAAFLRKYDLVPRAGARVPLRAALPKSPVDWVMTLITLAAGAAYLYVWFKGNREALLDPLLQNDDARTGVFPFHRYGPEHALKDDPIANEMLSFVPPFLRLLYMILVPLTGLFMAVKYLQLMCVGIILAAGYVCLRGRRAGAAAGVLLVVMMLHTPFVMNRIAGGFPRSFAFPCFALWLAGAFVASERVRWIATLLGALTYPSATGMMLAAEGLFTLRQGINLRRAFFGRLKRYACLVAACFLFLLPSMPGKEAGPLHNLEQAEKEPAFGSRGRLPQLPFANPRSELPNHFFSPLEPVVHSKATAAVEKYRAYDFFGPFTVLVLVLLLTLSRVAPTPFAGGVFFLGTTIVYMTSVAFAFKLYSPERYYHYGMPTAMIALVVSSIALVGPRLARRRRAMVRNLVTLFFLGAFYFWTGNGITPKNGMTIEGKSRAKLYTFIKTLPVDSRLGSHPMDGDDVPLWTGRAMMGGYETLQPWLVNGWAKAKARAEDSLRTMYSTDRGEVLAYCDKYKVSHFLVNKDRYAGDLNGRAAMFEPLGTFVQQVLAKARREDMVFANIPPAAVVFTDAPFVVVDVAKLRQAWGM